MSPDTGMVRRTFLFDLHNTLYDEVLEYGEAMAAAIEALIAGMGEYGFKVSKDEVCTQIAAAHRQSGNDWDEGLWASLPVVQTHPDPGSFAETLKDIRDKAARRLIGETAYAHAVRAVKYLKAQGHQVYIVTEGTPLAAQRALDVLDLHGTVDAVFTWPSADGAGMDGPTPILPYPADPFTPAKHVQKPHCAIMAAVIRHCLVEAGELDRSLGISDLFDFIWQADGQRGQTSHPPTYDVERPMAWALASAHGTRMRVKEAYQAVIEPLRAGMYFIGDSVFKDGFLSQYAGARFIHAKYGLAGMADGKRRDEASAVLDATTGWQKDILHATNFGQGPMAAQGPARPEIAHVVETDLQGCLSKIG